jgi:hypothetical protein
MASGFFPLTYSKHECLSDESAEITCQHDCCKKPCCRDKNKKPSYSDVNESCCRIIEAKTYCPDVIIPFTQKFLTLGYRLTTQADLFHLYTDYSRVILKDRSPPSGKIFILSSSLLI